jgi:hypothetical protein
MLRRRSKAATIASSREIGRGNTDNDDISDDIEGACGVDVLLLSVSCRESRVSRNLSQYHVYHLTIKSASDADVGSVLIAASVVSLPSKAVETGLLSPLMSSPP